MGEVLPFVPKNPPAAPTRPTGRQLAAEQNRAGREAYIAAALGQANDRMIAAGTVVPARISIAMNIGGHEGPAVDKACGTWEGNPEGDVDGWELGETVPSAEQVELMAAFTGFPKVWFYRPMKPGPLLGHRDGEPNFLWLCGPGGCTAVKSDWVDERGVLHYSGDEDGQRQPRTAVQGALPIDVEPVAKKPRARAPRKGRPELGSTQPLLPTSARMPDHLRAELTARLEARKKR